jgi:hypothetical protein
MKSPITQWWRQSVVHRDARGFFSVGNEKFTLNLSIAQIASSRNTPASVTMPTEASGRDFGRFRKRG